MLSSYWRGFLTTCKVQYQVNPLFICIFFSTFFFYFFSLDAQPLFITQEEEGMAARAPILNGPLRYPYPVSHPSAGFKRKEGGGEAGRQGGEIGGQGGGRRAE